MLAEVPKVHGGAMILGGSGPRRIHPRGCCGRLSSTYTPYSLFLPAIGELGVCGNRQEMKMGEGLFARSRMDTLGSFRVCLVARMVFAYC
jgi:hypothetical protein